MTVSSAPSFPSFPSFSFIVSPTSYGCLEKTKVQHDINSPVGAPSAKPIPVNAAHIGATIEPSFPVKTAAMTYMSEP
jgi:hypothetical protein